MVPMSRRKRRPFCGLGHVNQGAELGLLTQWHIEQPFSSAGMRKDGFQRDSDVVVSAHDKSDRLALSGEAGNSGKHHVAL